MQLLTINAGSSSIKYKVFMRTQQRNHLILGGLIEGIGEQNGQWHHQYHEKETRSHTFLSHQAAFDELVRKLRQDLQNSTIEGVGHRVVHGGTQFFEPTLITTPVLKELKTLSPLAPLHNPVNIAGIEYAMQHFPNAEHIAVFDSGFHHTLPAFTREYAIDRKTAKQYGIQRYGFHGINHEYVATKAAEFLNKPLENCHFISLHLGNGASACLIKNGQSFDTSMGMTPLAGLIMGTRCGDIDPGILLHLLKQGLAPAEIDTLLNKNSGLKGLAKNNDMRAVLALCEEGDDNAFLAIDMYCYNVQKTIGAYLTQLHDLTALIFTGGIGENSEIIRHKILQSLTHLNFNINLSLNSQKNRDDCHLISDLGSPILVIRSDEEDWIAQKIALLINEKHKQ